MSDTKRTTREAIDRTARHLERTTTMTYEQARVRTERAREQGDRKRRERGEI